LGQLITGPIGQNIGSALGLGGGGAPPPPSASAFGLLPPQLHAAASDTGLISGFTPPANFGSGFAFQPAFTTTPKPAENNTAAFVTLPTVTGNDTEELARLSAAPNLASIITSRRESESKPGDGQTTNATSDKQREQVEAARNVLLTAIQTNPELANWAQSQLMALASGRRPAEVGSAPPMDFAGLAQRLFSDAPHPQQHNPLKRDIASEIATRLGLSETMVGC
jgi:hypothetical protein